MTIINFPRTLHWDRPMISANTVIAGTVDPGTDPTRPAHSSTRVISSNEVDV